jgi:hypothetical protein
MINDQLPEARQKFASLWPADTKAAKCQAQFGYERKRQQRLKAWI